MDENINLNEEQKRQEITNEVAEEKEEFKPYVFTSLEPTPEQMEKSKIKALGRVSGIAFLIFYGVMLLLNVVLILITTIFSKGYNNAINFLYEPAIQQAQQIIFSLTVFTIPFVSVFKLFGFRISELISFKIPKGKNSLYLFLTGISFCSFANIAASFAERVFDNAGIDYEVDFGDNPEGIFGFLLSFIATAIVPALVEEFACRGILLGALKKQGEAFAIIASSVLFGLMHGNFEQIPFAFLVGLVLSFIVIKSDSIWIAVAVHCFNNSISVIYTYLLSGLSGLAQNLSYTIFLIVCLILGLFSLTRLQNEDGIFKLSNENTVCSLKLRLKWFFTSIPVIIFAVICLLGSLSYFK